MKIKQLTIHNLASYTDVTIDFDAEPLKSADVFLISGSVGSGKSTILDAITLALFARTPRFGNTDKRGSGSKFDDIGLDKPIHMVRRGEKTGFAKLTFEADGRDYEAEWSATGSKESHSLTDLGTKEVFTGRDDADSMITRLIGVNFEEFCRTTMLAQGEFSKFLKSSSDEKSRILEKVTGATIFQKIGERIFAITSGKKSTTKEAKIAMDSINVLKASEIKERERTINRCGKEKASADKQSQELQTDLQWLKAHEKLKKASLEANGTLEKAMAKRDDKYDEAVSCIRDYDNSTDIRGTLSSLHSETTTRDAAQRNLDEYRETFGELLGNIEHIRRHVNEDKSARNILADKLREDKPYDAVLGKADTIATNLRNGILNSEREKSKLEEAATVRQDLNDRLEPALNVANEKFDAIDKRINAMLEEEDRLDNTAEYVNRAAIRSDFGQKTQEKSNLEKAADAFDAVFDAENEAAGTASQIETLKVDVANAESAIKDKALEVSKLSAIAKAAKDYYETVAMSASDAAESLRAALEVGDPCPVCGRTIEQHLPVEATILQLVKNAKEKLGLAEDNFKNANKDLSDATTAKAVKENELKTANGALDKLKRSLEAGKADLQHKLSGCNSLKSVPTINRQAVETAVKNVETELKTLRTSIEKADEIENAIRKLKAEIKAEKQNKTAAKEALDRAKENVDDAVKHLNALNGEAKAFSASAAENFAQAKELLAPCPDWQRQAQEDAAAFADRILERKKCHDAMAANLAELEAAIKANEASANRRRDICNRLVATNPSWADVAPDAGAADIADNVYDTLGENANKQTAILNRAIDNIATHQKKLDEYSRTDGALPSARLEELNKLTGAEIGEMRTSVGNIDQAASNALALAGRCSGELKAHDASMPKSLKSADGNAETPTAKSLELRITDLKLYIENCNQEIGRLQGELANNEILAKQKETAKEHYEQCKEQSDRWSVLSGIFGDKTGKGFREIAMRYVTDTLIVKANSYMKTLTNRYTLAVDRGNYNILVLDAYQGDAARLAKTISGGETFQVSLALALALSDMGGNCSSNILFIDEGFGSLSGAELDNAITTLRSLRGLGRRVGIISHIPEVAEQIPVAIRVNRQSNASTSEVSVDG